MTPPLMLTLACFMESPFGSPNLTNGISNSTEVRNGRESEQVQNGQDDVPIPLSFNAFPPPTGNDRGGTSGSFFAVGRACKTVRASPVSVSFSVLLELAFPQASHRSAWSSQSHVAPAAAARSR